MRLFLPHIAGKPAGMRLSCHAAEAFPCAPGVLFYRRNLFPFRPRPCLQRKRHNSGLTLWQAGWNERPPDAGPLGKAQAFPPRFVPMRSAVVVDERSGSFATLVAIDFASSLLRSPPFFRLSSHTITSRKMSASACCVECQNCRGHKPARYAEITTPCQCKPQEILFFS